MRSASEKAAAVSALRNDGKQMKLRAGGKKDFELTVECLRCSSFAPRSLFNCGIRVERKNWTTWLDECLDQILSFGTQKS
jgi:hypothetical protein